jgi:carboxymethylenebutenolidase
MRRKRLVTAVLLYTASAAWCLQARDVYYPSGNETVSGKLYVPPGKGPFPAMVVIHEWWGLNDWIEQQAEKLAEQGYVALAVDLYRGKVATTPEEAHELMRGVPPDRATRDLLAAATYLRAQKMVDPVRVGAIGWCMGGGYAFDLAVNDPRLAATVINYGHISTSPDTLKKISAPVLGIFGGQDRGIPVADVRQFEQALKRLRKPVEIAIFADAGHAFENPSNKGGYRAGDAAEAWRKIVSFLAHQLQGKH